MRLTSMRFDARRCAALTVPLTGTRDDRVDLVVGVDLDGAVEVARLGVLGDLQRHFVLALVRGRLDAT